MSNRTDSQPLAHHDTGRQSRRMKLKALSAKIVWVGTISQLDREKLLGAIKTPNKG